MLTTQNSFEKPKQPHGDIARKSSGRGIARSLSVLLSLSVSLSTSLAVFPKQAAAEGPKHSVPPSKSSSLKTATTAGKAGAKPAASDDPAAEARAEFEAMAGAEPGAMLGLDGKQLDPKNDPKGTLAAALKAYQSGKYGQAAAILASDMQANPDDGTVHYYMGLALKKQGYDMKALHELEKAARLVPPEMIKKFADEQIGNLDEPDTPSAGQPAQPAASSGDWWSNLGNGINQMFGGKPAASGTANGGTASTSTPNTLFGMPDVMGQIKDAVKQGKKMLRQQQEQQQAQRSGGGGGRDYIRRQVGEAEIMHMDEMQDLVHKSHSMNVSAWASDPSGVVAFEQAPENTQAWDYWIGRFKRAFQHVLMRHLYQEAPGQVRGAAACIFSVDKAGNLRGQVYASTADPVLNKCLVETIRDLNHSRILAFPSTSRITGWNFQMSWNFSVYLAIVKRYRQQKEHEEAVQAMIKLAKEEEELKATALAAKEKREKAKKLAAEKALKAKLLIKPPPEAKQEVAGRVLTPVSERELQAVALELKDLKPVSADAAQPNVDPFASIDDQTINSWPDLNK